MTRGLGTFWVVFMLSTAGMLFPSLFARDFLDDPSIVRWISIPLFVASAVVLVDHYLVRLI